MRKVIRTEQERRNDAKTEELSSIIICLLEPNLIGPLDTDVFAVIKEIDEMYQSYSDYLSRSQLIQVVKDRIDDMRLAGEQTLINCDDLEDVLENLNRED